MPKRKDLPQFSEEELERRFEQLPKAKVTKSKGSADLTRGASKATGIKASPSFLEQLLGFASRSSFFRPGMATKSPAPEGTSPTAMFMDLLPDFGLMIPFSRIDRVRRAAEAFSPKAATQIKSLMDARDQLLQTLDVVGKEFQAVSDATNAAIPGVRQPELREAANLQSIVRQTRDELRNVERQILDMEQEMGLRPAIGMATITRDDIVESGFSGEFPGPRVTMTREQAELADQLGKAEDELRAITEQLEIPGGEEQLIRRADQLKKEIDIFEREAGPRGGVTPTSIRPETLRDRTEKLLKSLQGRQDKLKALQKDPTELSKELGSNFRDLTQATTLLNQQLSEFKEFRQKIADTFLSERFGSPNAAPIELRKNLDNTRKELNLAHSRWVEKKLKAEATLEHAGNLIREGARPDDLGELMSKAEKLADDAQFHFNIFQRLDNTYTALLGEIFN